MKKILTLSISLMLVIGIVSLAKSSDIDNTLDYYKATGDSKDRHVVKSSNGTMVVVYTNTSMIDGLRAKRSTDFGVTWTNLQGGPGYTVLDFFMDSDEFSICIDNNDNIYLAYHTSAGFPTGIWFRKLLYSSATNTWSLDLFAKIVDISSWQGRPSIVRQSSGRIWVAYADKTLSGAQVLATYSDNEFQTFGTTTQVSPPNASDVTYYPVVVLRSGNPFIVYAENEVASPPWYKSYWSSWNGSSRTWTAPAEIPALSGVSSGIPGGELSVTVAGSDVHAVVRRRSDMTHSYYNGSAWSIGEILSTSPHTGEYPDEEWRCWDLEPSLTNDGANVWCLASIYVSGTAPDSKYNIEYKKRIGSTWDADWTAVTTDNAVNRWSTTPLTTTSYIPFAWTESSSYPYTVKYGWLDCAPPPPPNVDDGVAGWSSDNTPRFWWDAVQDVSGIARYWWAVDNPTPEIGGNWTTGLEATTNPLTDGTHTFYVKAQDGVGLIGAAGSHVCQIDATPPPAPDITSPTHPTQTEWYNRNGPTFNWTCLDNITAITGYSYDFNQDPTSTPDTISETTETTKEYDDVLDGTWYFHVRARDEAGNWGATRHYQINIDTVVPADPTLVLKDQTSGSTTYTNSQTVDVTVGNDADAVAWLISENQSTQPAPGDARWGSEPVTFTLSAVDGLKTVYIWVKDCAGNINTGPVSATITLDTQIPSDPTLVLDDQTSGSTTYTNSQTVNITVGNDGEAVAWLLREGDSTRPQENDSAWVGVRPDTFNLTAGDGPKRVYIWVKDQAGSINTGPVSATITLDTVAPADPTLVLSDQTSGSTTYTDSQIVDAVVGNDNDAVAWLISEGQSTQPPEDDSSWVNIEPVTFTLSAVDGLKRVYIWVKDRAGNINTGPVSATITLDMEGIADPTLVLRDQTSGNTMFTNSQTVDVVVGNDGEAVAWLISETQSTQPAENDSRWGIEPVTFNLSAVDGPKTVYIWVKDIAGHINQGPVSATITLDTIVPANPTLVLSDQTSGSTMFTNSQTVNVGVGNDADAVAWLISESQSTQPPEDDSRWGIEPVTFTLSAGDGAKTVYIWVKDRAGNMNQGPVSATITLDTQMPVNPTLVLSDQTAGSTAYTNSQLVDVVVGNDAEAVAWLISESQSTQPPEDDSRWGIEPVAFNLSAVDGLKRVYIWVKDRAGNMNSGPVSTTITLDTMRPADPTLVLRDQTSGSTTYTNSGTVDVVVGNDGEAVAWLISETQATQPPENDPRWGIEPVAFNLGAVDGLKRVYIWVKDAAGNINSGPVSATITLDTQVPVNPTLVLKDQTTGSTMFTNSRIVDAEVGNDSEVSAWLISESQSIQPVENDPSWGSEPATFTLSIGDGLKTVYIWVKDRAGNINIGPVSATITLDTQIPTDPTLVLRDQTSGSTIVTDSQIVDVEVGNDADAVAWLISETQATQPPENDFRWGSEPVTFTLSAGDGPKRVYIWVKDRAGNINQGAVSATITLDMEGIADPTLVLRDQTSGSTTYANSQLVNAVVGNDGEAVAWLISESQSVQPPENDSRWGSEPVTFTLSAGDGPKRVYIWVKDIAGHVNQGPVSATITLDTIPPVDPTLVLKDQTTGSTAYTDSRTVDVVVGNDSGVSAWLISESQSVQPVENDPGWGSEPVTFTLSAGDALKTVYIWVKDAAGNINSGPVSATIILDATPPPKPYVSSWTHPDQSKWYANNDPEFEWICDDSVSGISAYSYLLDQNPGTIPFDISMGTGTSTTCFDIADGTWYFHVKARNGSGLWGETAHYRVNIGVGPSFTVYRITSTVTSARTVDPFKLIIELIDPQTGLPKRGANNSFDLSARTVDFKDAPGKWSTGDPLLLNDGRAEIWVTYDTVGTIVFKVSDNLGNTPGYTEPVDVLPVGLRYQLSAPAKAEAGKEFPLMVKLIDTGAGNVIAPAKYDREVRLVAYSSPSAALAEGKLKVKSLYLQGGMITISESYDLAENIYIEGYDAQLYNPPSQSGRTGIIEVIGAPDTVLRFEGIYQEMNAGVYMRTDTLITIISVSDIVAETILYRDNGEDWKTYVEPFTLSPGRHIIEYYGIDKYSHKEEINRSKPLYVSFFGGGDGVSNRPNPFKAGREPTLIEYNLKEPSSVTITIYDLFGGEVWNKSYAAGENGGRKVNSVPWDGRNLSGKVVANGGYICRVWIEKEKRHMLRKIAVAK